MRSLGHISMCMLMCARILSVCESRPPSGQMDTRASKPRLDSTGTGTRMRERLANSASNCQLKQHQQHVYIYFYCSTLLLACKFTLSLWKYLGIWCELILLGKSCRFRAGNNNQPVRCCWINLFRAQSCTFCISMSARAPERPNASTAHCYRSPFEPL